MGMPGRTEESTDRSITLDENEDPVLGNADQEAVEETVETAVEEDTQKESE